MRNQRVTPPGINAELMPLTPAPAEFDRGFLIPTPVDEATGLPWVMYPPEYSLPTRRSDLADENHAFHPSRSPLLATPAGEALKACRVQRVDWYDHHIVYHGYFDGPPIPTTEEEIFKTLVFAAAKYIPDMAIDCRGYQPEYVPISQKIKTRLWQTGEIKMDRPGVVRGFFANYLIGQDISHVKNSRIDEFVTTPDDTRRQFLGQWLLAQAAEVATEPISPQYRVAQQTGRIVPGLTRKPENLVKDTLGNRFERSPYLTRLHAALAEAA